MSTDDALAAALRSLEEANKEIARLKRGDFTPEEFQEICHNRQEKPGCTKEAFFEGCHLFQKSLFGISEREKFRKALTEQWDRIEKLEQRRKK